MSTNYFQSVPVLMYHKITDRHEIGVTTVSVASFAKQMMWLFNNGYQTITPAQYANRSSKSIIISFDDAYSNVVENAFPIMERFGFKGLIFPIYNAIGRKNTWDANFAGIQFQHATEKQLIDLLKAGWEIGSHSKSHHIPTILENLEDEIVDVKKQLEEKFNTTVTSFSYPFGYSRQKLTDIVSKHYDYGFLATSVEHSDAYTISRSAVYRFDGIRQLRNKINLKKLECMKLKLIHSGSNATIVYQNIKK
jgi:peptidoglycan/xylan/chitin deacetylase (PgdA/CDA1 family)